MQTYHFYLRHILPGFLGSTVLALLVTLLAWCTAEQLLLSAFWLGLMMAALCLSAALVWFGYPLLQRVAGFQILCALGQLSLAGSAVLLALVLPSLFAVGSHRTSTLAQNTPLMFVLCSTLAGLGWSLVSGCEQRCRSALFVRMAKVVGLCVGSAGLILLDADNLSVGLLVLAAGCAGQGAYMLFCSAKAKEPVKETSGQGLKNRAKHLKTPLNILHVAVSGLFVGAYLIITPYFSSTQYSLSLSDYAILQFLVFLAALAAFFALAKRKPADHPGQAAIFSLMYMALIAYALSRMPTPFGFHCLMFFWGLNLAYAYSHIALIADKALSTESQPSPWFLLNLLALIATACGALIAAAVLDFRGQDFNEFFIGLSMVNACVFVGFLFTRGLWGWKLERSIRDE